MSAPAAIVTPSSPAPISAKWRSLPLILIGAGGLLGLIGVFSNPKQFAYSYLTAFICFLSVVLGGIFLTLIHHRFDK